MTTANRSLVVIREIKFSDGWIVFSIDENPALMLTLINFKAVRDVVDCDLRQTEKLPCVHEHVNYPFKIYYNLT